VGALPPTGFRPPGGLAFDYPAPQFVGTSALAGAAAPAGNVINVQGITAGSSLTLNGSGGHVTVNVGNAAGSLDDIRSPLIITGKGTADINVHDEGAKRAEVYTLGAGTLSRSGAGLISTSLPGALVVDGGKGGNRFDVESLSAGHPTTINAGPGGDLVRMRGGPISAALTLNGTGNTRLGYAAYTRPVYANLGTGVATDVATFRGIDSVTGGQGNNILVGDGGDDELIGGPGRNLLIGGGGHDHLVAGSDEDILIGGRTVYDDNRAALEAIMAEWGRTDLSYEARVHHLLHGSGGIPALNASTVFADGADVLEGGMGRDLFFAGLSDTVLNRRHDEVLVELD
jgi:Ca2+-binding RTX toxin-like protein